MDENNAKERHTGEGPNRIPLKDKVAIAQGFFTIVAIIFGGAWTHLLFVKDRQQYPHATVGHQATHVAVDGKTNVIHVSLEITNAGKARLPVKQTVIYVQQVLPRKECVKGSSCPDPEIDAALKASSRSADEFSWPVIAERKRDFKRERELEAGEKEQVHAEFAIPSDVKLVRIYAYLRDEGRASGDAEARWSTSSFYELR